MINYKDLYMTFALKERLMNEIKTRRIRSLGSKPTLWPSQASAQSEAGVVGSCLRSSFYEKVGVKETNPVSPAVTLMGYMGMQIENGLIEMIKNMGLWENNNVKWQAKGLSGEVDVICRDDGRKWIVECKSCSGYHSNKEVFGYMSGRAANKRWVPGKPKDKHLMQAAIYADIAKGTCDGALVIYISRDEAKMQEFLITIADDGRILIDGYPESRFTMHDIYARYELLKNAIDSNALPLPEYKHTYEDVEVDGMFGAKEVSSAVREAHMDGSKPHMDKECLYCKFRNVCVKDGPNAKENYIPSVVTTAPSKDSIADDWVVPETAKPIVNRPAYIAHGSF